jgi:hypothetical protein
VDESPDVLLDLNNPIFQDDLLSLEKEEAGRVLATLREIKKLAWSDVYRNKGLRWELVQSKTGPDGARLYTVRVSDKSRALVYRDGQFMRLLSLHPDHDSSYRWPASK